MEIRVIKLGGSVLRGSQYFNSIIELIKSYDTPIVIVVSAFYGQTNTLLNLLNSEQSEESIQAHFKSINNDLWQIMDSYDSDFALKYWHKIASRLSTLESYKTQLIKGCKQTSVDYHFVSSYGERLSSLLLSYLLKYNNINCHEKLPEDLGISCIQRSGNYIIDYNNTRRNLTSTIEKDKICIVPGFYGLDKHQEVVTLGRGGSDYTASSLAYCLHAKSLDIWKDVEGFMTTDPKIVQKAVNVDYLSYQEAAELAYFGAKILHPRTIEPAQLGQIPIRILDVHTPNQHHFKSIIGIRKPNNSCIIKSITSSDDYSILQLNGAGIGIEIGLLGKLAHLLAKGGINVKSVITSQTAINFLLSKQDLEHAKAICKRVKGDTIASLRGIQNISLIAAIGEGIIQHSGVAAQIFTALANQGINVTTISFGASKVAIYLIVSQRYKSKAVEAIHNELFKSNETIKKTQNQCLLSPDFKFHA